jgi:peroxiredoxin
MNDGSAEAMQEWVEREQLPFAILRDPDRAVATAYGIAQPDASRYVANNAEGRRPGVLVDEEGRVVAVLPDLRTVEDQLEALARLL